MKNNSYDDIINLPHPVSKNHPQMPLRDRAAQFAPFAALTGHDAAIKETARLTDERLELSEEAIAQLNEKINIISSMLLVNRVPILNWRAFRIPLDDARIVIAPQCKTFLP